MKKLLNTLFVVSPDTYLALENENVVIYREETVLRRIPLLTLENILYFGYKGASPALMGACAERNIGLCFLKPGGRFLARVCGASYGNVLLRKEQYRISDNPEIACRFARNFIAGKIYNSRSVIRRALRDHPLSVDKEKLEFIANELMHSVRLARVCGDLDELRGIEGNSAKLYFSVFEQLILNDKTTFRFNGRVKRPPGDAVNAMLSFVYVLLAHDCASALESVGLDSYVGFLHADRPGRQSLALDLMEELRSVYADRFILFLINNRMIKANCFDYRENGSVYLNDEGRKTVLAEWQKRKQDSITHPFLNEKIQWGLVPYAQALLLARCIRGDLDEYPAFLWK